ncbi:MAG TPA: cyanophycin synthetase, partial [Burkholderiales bacterium]|nr:cyanophycin synthetase [Burkholderiales bacterium]
PGRPTLILDVAHNPAAAEALAVTLSRMGRGGRTLVVFAMLRDKDIDGVIAAFGKRIAIDHWFVAGIDAPRGADAALLAEKLQSAQVPGAVTVCESIAQAYAQACDMAVQNDKILAFGSFYTVAAVIEARTKQRASSVP